MKSFYTFIMLFEFHKFALKIKGDACLNNQCKNNSKCVASKTINTLTTYGYLGYTCRCNGTGGTFCNFSRLILIFF